MTKPPVTISSTLVLTKRNSETPDPIPSNKVSGVYYLPYYNILPNGKKKSLLLPPLAARTIKTGFTLTFDALLRLQACTMPRLANHGVSVTYLTMNEDDELTICLFSSAPTPIYLDHGEPYLQIWAYNSPLCQIKVDE